MPRNPFQIAQLIARNSDEAQFAFIAESLQRRKSFFHNLVPVAELAIVYLNYVDPICSQTAKRLLYGEPGPLRGEIKVTHTISTAFRGKHNLVSFACQSSSQP